MEKKLLENEILIGGKTYAIKPIKMKYIKNNMFFTGYNLLKQVGFLKACKKYSDALEVFENYFMAIFDIEKLDNELLDNMDNKIVNETIRIVEKINDMEDDVVSKNEITPA